MSGHISSVFPVSQQGINEIRKEAAAERAIQIETKEDLNAFFELSAFNPMVQAQKFRDLKDLAKHTQKGRESEKTEETSEKIIDVQSIDETSERYQRKNEELNAKTLRILHSTLKQTDTSDEVLSKVEKIYQEAALADEALEFLTETTEGQLLAATQEAKEKLNKDKGKEIRAGRNMGAQSREFAKEGLGSPTSLRELYRDLILNPRDPLKLFDELTEKFRYPKLKTALTFMLHSLGADLKSKGPTIQRAELKRLLDETRSMQGILGVFRFFQSRMRLIQREFTSYKLVFPPKITFEILARVLIKLLAERFINPDKIKQVGSALGLSEETAAQIVIYSQMLDALKQISPGYFRNPRHKEELLKGFIDTLEKLEDQLEEEEEEEEK